MLDPASDGAVKPRSIQKLYTYKIASSPNDPAATNIVETIECKFEILWQDIEALQLNSCAALRNIVDIASENAALLIEKEQSVPVDFRPGNCSLFDHKASFESDAKMQNSRAQARHHGPL